MRPFLVWRDDWLLGFESLDGQHLELVEILNELHRYLVHDGVSRHVDRGELCRKLLHLLQMTRRHFEDEEALMLTHDYAGVEEHHREHALLVAELHDCIREIDTGHKPFTLATLTALKHWQIDHVINSDREFADYLRRRLRPISEIPMSAKPDERSPQHQMQRR
ncbi:MAG: bacteriohemerythrin [Candidatus Thiodiazotropha sp.]